MFNIETLISKKRAKLQLYRTSASTLLGRKLIEHPLYTVDLWICMFDDACHSWTEMCLCHSTERSVSLKPLYQSPPFFHHCKGKSMTYLEMDIICSRFFLFIKYSSHPMVVFFFFNYLFFFLFFCFFYLPGISSSQKYFQ